MNKTIIIAMLVNIGIYMTYIICVTVAAIHFGRPLILAWYLLTPFLSMNYSGEHE